MKPIRRLKQMRGLPILSVLVLALSLSACTTAPQHNQSQAHSTAATAVTPSGEWVHAADVNAFVQQMNVRYGFDPESLHAVLDQAQIMPSLIASMNHPSEKRLAWYQYRALFITPAVVQGGQDFMRQHEHILHRAEERYGVPPGIIVGILGAETRYGLNEGHISALNALYTLAFAYPRRETFFQNELAQYLILSRDANFDPVELKSSYAGALGMPQFMPSSYRAYAVADGEHYPDLFSNPNDVVLSVGNYFAKMGWQAGEPVAVQAVGAKHQRIPQSLLNQTLTLKQFAAQGVLPLTPHHRSLQAKLICLDGKTGPEYWLVFHNFNVIKRYNASDLYAMTIFQLSQLVAPSRPAIAVSAS